MAERLKFGTSEPAVVEVEIDDRVFTVSRLVRSVQRRIDEIYDALDKTEDIDEIVGCYGDLLDAITKPTAGARKTLGTIVRAKWDADDLALDDLVAFSDAAVKQAAERPN
jgi:hypothetical protein